jgi:hypothetical protein
MKRKSLIYCVMFLITSMFYSCNKNSDGIIQDQNLINGNEVLLIPTTATLVDEKSVVQSEDSEVVEAEEFAKLLASAINGKEVRKFIKDEANKKFDGDFDILVSKVLDSKIGQVNFKENVEQSSSFGASKGKEIFEKAIKNPKLNISVPIQIEKWDESKQQLLVAIAVGYIDGETKFVKAFDSKGRLYLIDATKEPDVPVIVVGNNERMDYQEEVTNNEKSTRISGYTETITYIQCPDVSAIEGWLLSAPEIRFDCVVYLRSGNAASQAAKKQYDFSSRAAASNGVFLTQSLFKWYFDNASHGPDYYIQSAEIDDTGATHTITVGVTVGNKDSTSGTASYALTYKNSDDILAGELIHYLNPLYSHIYDSTIDFRVDSYFN